MNKKNSKALLSAVEEAREGLFPGRRSNAQLRAAACRAVEGGLSMAEVAEASGFGRSAVANWLGRGGQENVQVLAVREEPLQLGESPQSVVPEAPLASLEFGAFSLRLFVRAGG